MEAISNYEKLCLEWRQRFQHMDQGPALPAASGVVCGRGFPDSRAFCQGSTQLTGEPVKLQRPMTRIRSHRKSS